MPLLPLYVGWGGVNNFCILLLKVFIARETVLEDLQARKITCT